MSCLTLRSRSGVPICPRKYFETTMFVACCDPDFGISTSRCSNTTSPFSLPITAERSSHSISSNGSTPASVKKRGKVRPGADAAFFERGFSASADIGTCDVPLLSTDCWPAPATFMAARSSICPQLPLLRRYPEQGQVLPASCGKRSSGFLDFVRGGRSTLIRPSTRNAGKLSVKGLVARRTANMRPTPPFVNNRSTRYCGSLLGRTQDVDGCVSLWT